MQQFANESTHTSEGEAQLQVDMQKPFWPTSVVLIQQYLEKQDVVCGEREIAFEVTTKDDVMLAMHRIPRPGAPAVLVQHGLMGTSADWLQLGENSMPFILWKAGFDVWLGNNRGNDYSEELHALDKQQWDFSFEELGRFDFPALVEGVLEHSGQPKLVYVGYSLGTLQAFLGLSEQSSEWQQQIRLYVALAPISYMESLRGGLFNQSFLAKMVHSAVGSRKDPFRSAIKNMCKLSCRTCANQVYGGGTFVKGDCARFFDYNPAGTSVKNLRHMSQYIYYGYPHRYDLGPKDNLKSYGASVPPPFCLERISVPTAIIYGTKDWLADAHGVARLEQDLRNQYRERASPFRLDNDSNLSVRSHQAARFGHVDFIWSIEAKTQVYDVVQELVKKTDEEINARMHHPPRRQGHRFVFLAFCHAWGYSRCPTEVESILANMATYGKTDGTPCARAEEFCGCGLDAYLSHCPDPSNHEGHTTLDNCNQCFCQIWCSTHRTAYYNIPGTSCFSDCSKWIEQHTTLANANPQIYRCE